MWKRFFGALPLVVLALLCSAAPAPAQFLGYASPQTVTKNVLNNPDFTCDGSNNAYSVQNLGQSQHYVAYRFLSGPGQNIAVGIQGSMDTVNWLAISDVSSNQPTGAVTGSGYYPAIRVSVLCTGGGTVSINVNYSGTSVANGINAGVNDFGAYQKVLWQLDTAGDGHVGDITPTPYGNTSGVIYFQYTGAGPGASTIAVDCQTPTGLVSIMAATAVATTDGDVQTFIIPSLPCSEAIATYQPGGASASRTSSSYLFSKPGAPPSMGGPAANVNVTNNPLNVDCVAGCAGGGGTQDVNLLEVDGAPVSLGQAAAADSLPVVLASDQPAITVDQGVSNARSDPWSTGLDLVGGVGIALGQTAMVNSLPVVIAADQSPIDVNIASVPSTADPCADPFVVPASEFIAASAEVVSAVGGQTVYVCGFTLTFYDTAATVSSVAVVTGTGVTCTTGLTPKSGLATPAVNVPVTQNYARSGSVFVSGASEAVCVLFSSGTGNASGMLTYVQQ